MDILPGTAVGGYVLKQFIGSGGMGTVYLAEDQAIGQQVAIKIIRTDSIDSPDASAANRVLERFKQEARAVASLDHLHILPLYRYGEEQTNTGKRAYMVMQYRPEGSLWDWLRRRSGMNSGIGRASVLPPMLPATWPLSLTETNEYLQQAASALQYAHDRGIVHRDIKPANFLLRIDNGSTVHLLLSDFGLAKSFAASSATSTILGTPVYMAPEQFEGNAGPESDQYALAVMIYYFLAGRTPFEGEPLRLMHAHIMETPPPIRTFSPALPPAIEPVLAQALAKRSTDRFPTIADFASAFQAAAYGQSRPFPASPSSQSRPYAPVQPPVAPYAPFANQQTPPGAPIPTRVGNAFSSADNAPTVMQPGVSPIPPLPVGPVTPGADNAPTVAQPFWTAESAPTVAQPAWASSLPVAPATVAGVFADEYAPTVAQPALSQGWPAFDAAATGVASPPPPAEQAADSRQKMGRRGVLAWIGGGAAAIVVGAGATYLALHGATSTPTPTTTPPISSGTSTTTGKTNGAIVLSGHQDVVTSVDWSPDGTQLVSTSRDGTARIWSLANRQSSTTYTGHQGAVLTAAWRADGFLLASGGLDQSVQTWDPTGQPLHTYPGLGSPVSSISWAANSQALVAGTLGSGDDEIFLKSGRIVKSAQNFIVHVLAFSPDGHFLALGFDDGDVSIFDVNARHSRTFHRHNGAVLCLAWSSDGTQLASGGADHTAHIMNASNGHPLKTLAHHAPVNGVAWDPAGTTRLATACNDGGARIWSLSGNAHTTNKTSAPLTSISWNASGLAAGSANHTILIWKV